MNELVATARLLRDAGLPCEIVSGGGTGTYDISGRVPGVTEINSIGGYRKEFQVAPLPDAPLLLPSTDPAVRDVRVVQRPDLADLPRHPPIGRFLERWRAGDPFVHLGALWTP